MLFCILFYSAFILESAFKYAMKIFNFLKYQNKSMRQFILIQVSQYIDTTKEGLKTLNFVINFTPDRTVFTFCCRKLWLCEKCSLDAHQKVCVFVRVF